MKAWAVTKSLINIKSAWSDYLTEMVIAHLHLCVDIHVNSFLFVVTVCNYVSLVLYLVCLFDLRDKFFSATTT